MAGRTIEQPNATFGLQVANHFADRGLGHGKFARGRRKSSSIDNVDEEGSTIEIYDLLPWEARHRAEVDIVGRVLWFGRKVG